MSRVVNRQGERDTRRSKSAARTISSTLDEKVVLEKSLALFPRPVKSNRNTETPGAARPRDTREEATKSLEHVKRWEKRA